MSKSTPQNVTDKEKDEESSLYLPVELKEQIKALKLAPSEKLVDVVRRLVAIAEQQQKPIEGDSVTLVLSRKTFMQVAMSLPKDLAGTLKRSIKR